MRWAGARTAVRGRVLQFPWQEEVSGRRSRHLSFPSLSPEEGSLPGLVRSRCSSAPVCGHRRRRGPWTVLATPVTDPRSLAGRRGVAMPPGEPLARRAGGRHGVCWQRRRRHFSAGSRADCERPVASGAVSPPPLPSALLHAPEPLSVVIARRRPLRTMGMAPLSLHGTRAPAGG